MKISVVTIVYNDAAHIEGTLLNVLEQTAVGNIEYIVVDGASTDGTSEIIGKYTSRLAKYICEPDTGIYNAMNKGLAAASGDYIVFINSGDRFSGADVVERMMDAIGDSRPDVAFGHYREFCNGGDSASQVIPCRPASRIWYGPVASHQSTFYRLSHLREKGLRYDESYRIAADYKLTTEAVVNAASTLKTDICVSDFDVSGVSSTNQNQGLKEANRVRHEVLGWSRLRIYSLTAVLLGARYAKKYAKPLYDLLRH